MHQAHGGDWILQPALSNAPSIAKLLPPVAPLSTLRLVTASRASLHQRPAEASSLDKGGVEVLSACFRAGRAGASTDHSCVMFDVDVATGDIRRGTTSAHWYQLGLARARRCPLFSEGHTVETGDNIHSYIAENPFGEFSGNPCKMSSLFCSSNDFSSSLV